jgi:hypothetical protein
MENSNREFFQCSTGYDKCQDGKSCYRRSDQECGMEKTFFCN